MRISDWSSDVCSSDLTNLVVEPILVAEDIIQRVMEQWQQSNDSLGDALGDDDDLDNLDISGGDEDAGGDAGVEAKGDDTPVVKFVNKVLIDAIRRGASDIQFEPYETDYRVRLPLDRKDVVRGKRVSV